MELNDYQNQAAEFAFYKNDDLSYCALGITGEGGEIADHIKKMIRDDKNVLTDDRKDHLLKELGDVMWYVARMAGKLGYSLNDVAKANIVKLQDRTRRGTQHGSGDNR
jgi:NTP pyrophosphatase (non-canonical NTP hydrolase)